MSFAAVDIGNTAVKVAILREGELAAKCSFPTVEEGVEWCKAQGAGSGAFCSTRKLSGAERGYLSEASLWEFTSESDPGIEVCYVSRGTLGPDRLASAAGAVSRFPGRNVLVADAGTALTLDLVDSGGRFLGGNISPGVGMRFRAMHEFTSSLPSGRWEDSEGGDCFGVDTLSALSCGVRWGMANEIAGALRLAGERFPRPLLALTGGDGALLRENLERVTPAGAEIVFEPDLVALGLMKAYNLNHDK